MTRIALLLGACLTIGIGSAAAQTPKNPTVADFDDANFDKVSGYELGYFTSAAAAAPLQTAAITKPATCAPCSTPIASRPTAFGNYWIAVRGVAGTVVSEWSNRLPFENAPLAPTLRRVAAPPVP
jgi:hypothetical protein